MTGYEKYTPGTGIGWKINLINGFEKNGLSYACNHHKGWGSVKIGKAHNKSGSIESSSLSAKYFHKQLGVTGSLEFGASGPSVGISSSWGYDTSNDTGYQWNWYHKNY